MSALRQMIEEARRESEERRHERQREEERKNNALPRIMVGTTPPADDAEPDDELPNEPNQLASYDRDLVGMLVDWSKFWDKDATEAQWLAEPVFAQGRAHAIYAPGGTGKSLFSLWLAAALATGKQGLDDYPLQRRRVLYLDYEMTHEDLVERLSAMGYNEDCDLSWLHYALLPSLPPADAPEGGKAIARLAQLVDAELVILDTFSRAVTGDENDADTVRAFYRWTGLHLKAEGRAFARIDHAGKDIEKGQRGTSAKNDDVDVVWQMVKADGGFKLTAKKRRMGWVPESLALLQYDSPNLHYRIVDDVAPAGTDAVVRDLDALGVPPSLSSRKAAQLLRDGGKGSRDVLVRAAQRQRMKRDFRTQPRPEDRDAHNGVVAGRGSGRTTLEMPSDQARTHLGTRADAVGDADGTRAVSLDTAAAQREARPQPWTEDDPDYF